MYIDRVGVELAVQEVYDGRGSHGGPGALATGTVGDWAVDQHKADGLFGQVVGQPEPRHGDESEVGVAFLCIARGYAPAHTLLRHLLMPLQPMPSTNFFIGPLPHHLDSQVGPCHQNV